MPINVIVKVSYFSELYDFWFTFMLHGFGGSLHPAFSFTLERRKFGVRARAHRSLARAEIFPPRRIRPGMQYSSFLVLSYKEITPM
jgi:hypothetical protein